MAKTCPSCGKTDLEAEFVGSFCVDCYSERFRVFTLPKEFSVRICSRCKRLFAKGKWITFDEGLLKSWLLEKVKSQLPLANQGVSLRPLKKGYRADFKFVFDAEGTRIEKQASLNVEVDRNLCDDCHKKSGGYHEAVIQLRGGDIERLRKLAETLAVQIQKSSFVSGYEEKKEGIDFLAGSRRAAMQAVNGLGREFTVSNKLTGMKEGKRLFRASICIRL